MQPSLTLCRAREAHHLALAGAAMLDNVKSVATIAAAAWAKEALAAGLREDRKARTRAFDEARAMALDPPYDEIRGFSENPDRGHSSAA